MTLDEYRIVMKDLGEWYFKCKEDNWDGEGAKALSEKTYKKAQDIIMKLPALVPAPEIGVESHGPNIGADVSLEWHLKNKSVVALTIDDKGIRCAHAFMRFRDDEK